VGKNRGVGVLAILLLPEIAGGRGRERPPLVIVADTEILPAWEAGWTKSST